jgi:hypothetical protein
MVVEISPMSTRIRLPGGTLKLKRYPELRGSERRREVPVVSIGGLYLVWWSRSAMEAKAREGNREFAAPATEAPD